MYRRVFCLARLRNVIERVNGLLKTRFSILKRALEMDFRNVTNLLYSLVCLNNLLLYYDPVASKAMLRALVVAQEEPEPLVQLSQDCADGNLVRSQIAQAMWAEY